MSAALTAVLLVSRLFNCGSAKPVVILQSLWVEPKGVQIPVHFFPQFIDVLIAIKLIMFDDTVDTIKTIMDWRSLVSILLG